MNGKLAKKIRKLSKLVKPDVENETDYKLKSHAPRYAMRTEMQKIELDDGTSYETPKQVPFRLNTTQRFVSLECRRGVDRLMKKQYLASARA